MENMQENNINKRNTQSEMDMLSKILNIMAILLFLQLMLNLQIIRRLGLTKMRNFLILDL